MRRAYVGAWLCCCVFAMNLAHAAAPAPLPELTAALLVDQAGILSEDERQALSARLRAVQASGRAQVAIMLSSGTGGEPLADYSLRIAERWQLGRAGKDDGLLVVVVPPTGAVRIEVGYGLEGEIPDARASQWVDQVRDAVKSKELAAGLHRLLDRIDEVLPRAAQAPAENNLFDDHPEWRVPFLLVVFSPFALFPLFFGRWGCVASGPLFALFAGGAAWALWSSQTAGLIAAGIAFPFPFLWALNWSDSKGLAPRLRRAKAFGNVLAVLLFFAIITLFVGGGLSAMEVGPGLWIGVVFAGLLATGLAVMLFPGRPALILGRMLASAMQFVFVLTIAWTALYPFVAHPGGVACAVAGAVTALAALGLYLESRGRVRGSRWCYGLVLVAMLPLGLLALVLASIGEELEVQLAQAAAGGGSIAGALMLAAKHGVFAAMKIGLGGRFGGGGAGR